MLRQTPPTLYKCKTLDKSGDLNSGDVMKLCEVQKHSGADSTECVSHSPRSSGCRVLLLKR